MRFWQAKLTFIVPVALILSSSGQLRAQTPDPYEFLDIFDQQPTTFTPEEPAARPPDLPEEPADPVSVDLRPFYEEFARDHKITFYVGYGIGTYHPGRGRQIFDMLQALAAGGNSRLVDWKLGDEGHLITFRDADRGLRYSIQVGFERNEFIRAFSEHEIVMYHGHSRYGQGPAFQSYQNYFRIGRGFETVEVDSRNTYFLNDPIVKTDRYPVRQAWIGPRHLPFQYRGQKDSRSKLPKSSYTKNIPGKDRDWVKTRFLPGRQIFYLYSCMNRRYWREAIRDLHPDIGKKAVFGTYKNGRGATKPEALMIMSIVNQLSSGTEILDTLNTTKDCDKCFTTF